MRYQIIVKGMLDENWADWLGEVDLTTREENGVLVTIIRSDVPDQPALFGILDRIRDLNLPLISVTRVDLFQSNDSKRKCQ